jgi:hypothetical protein
MQAGDAGGAARDIGRAYAEARDERSSAEAGHDPAVALTTQGNYAEAVAVLKACAEAAAGTKPIAHSGSKPSFTRAR